MSNQTKEDGLPSAIADFVDVRGRKPRKCWVCNIPEVNDIDTAWKVGRSPNGNKVTVRLLLEYLIEKCQYSTEDATEDKLRSHFRRNHHTLDEVGND